MEVEKIGDKTLETWTPQEGMEGLQKKEMVLMDVRTRGG